MPKPRDRSFALGATIVVVAVIALGFYNSGSPRVQRQIAIDRSRVERLRAIVQEIHNRPALPAALADLKSAYVRIADPDTDVPFEYQPKDETHYDLCAIFTADSEDWEQKPNSRSAWAHPAGRHCFGLDSKVDPWLLQ